MTSTIKVDNIQDQDGNNIINENANTITIGASGDTVSLPSGVKLSGVGTVSWQTTVKTTAFTAASGEGYFCNTTSAAFTVTLPSSPTALDIVAIKDYALTFDTNNLTIDPGSNKIEGSTIDMVISTEGRSLTLVYLDSTQGWKVVNDGNSTAGAQASYVTATGGTITTCGDFKIHTFTGPGTFTVSCAGNASGNNQLEYTVVGGGGGGSRGANAGGAGGAGGFRFASPSIAPLTYPGKPLAGSTLTATAQGYPITVGAGGTGGADNPNPGCVGASSTFSTITSAGGGQGGSTGSGGNGGSGGGGGSTADSAFKSGGTGNTPPVSPAQGTNGGRGRHQPGSSEGGGGGGGAISAGGDGDDPSPNGGRGGNGGAGAGLPTAFGSNGVPCGSFRYYAGGGSGSGNDAGTAGLGGGGSSGTSPSGPGGNGTANTGGGGGGAQAPGTGGTGGSGVVIIRYKFQN